jgi:hypothetical protein
MEQVLRILVGKHVILRLHGVSEWLNGTLDLYTDLSQSHKDSDIMYTLDREAPAGTGDARRPTPGRIYGMTRSYFSADDVVFVQHALATVTS